MTVSWPDDVDEVLGGDMTAALAYVTPAGGSVVTGVAPVRPARPRAGTVTFTTSFGLPKKLERIARDPHVALAYHAREHGFAHGDAVRARPGRARPIPETDLEWNENVLGPAAAPFMGPPRAGAFWDRWLREYYADRVPVTIDVERIVVWPALDASGEPEVHGSPRPAAPEPQAAPKKGTRPRVDAEKAARKLARLPHLMLSWRESDGHPTVVPVRVGERGRRRHPPRSARPRCPRAGAARAARPLLRGQPDRPRARQHTGWLEDGLYAPHTETGFAAPKNKTLLLLANGLLAKRGLRKARKEGKVPAGGLGRRGPAW